MTARSDLPSPLVPHDIDVDGINGFLLHTDRLFHSELWALSTGEEFKAAVALWGHAWKQHPAGSLPNNDRLLAAFSGAGSRWKRVKAMALRGFVLCSDDRYYHKVLCEDVLRAARAKDQRKDRTAAATRARNARAGDDHTPPGGGKKLNENNKTPPRNVERHVERNDRRDDDRYDVRHERRNERRDDDVTSATRGSLRSPKEVEGEGKKKENIPAAACEPVPGTPPRSADWATRANFDRVETRCRSVLPRDWVNDLVVSPMARLEADGLDLETEIVPTLIDLAASRRSPIRTWSTLANAVAERVAVQRQSRTAQGLPEVPPAQPRPEDLVDMSPHGRYAEATIRQWVARHRENPGSWNENVFGPPPGAPSCKVPARLLIGEAA